MNPFPLNELGKGSQPDSGEPQRCPRQVIRRLPTCLRISMNGPRRESAVAGAWLPPRRCHRVLERRRQSGSFKVNALSIIRLPCTPRPRARSHRNATGPPFFPSRSATVGRIASRRLAISSGVGSAEKAFAKRLRSIHETTPHRLYRNSSGRLRGRQSGAPCGSVRRYRPFSLLAWRAPERSSCDARRDVSCRGCDDLPVRLCNQCAGRSRVGEEPGLR